MSGDTNNNGLQSAASAALTANSIQTHIPHYLTLEQKEALANALSRFPADSEYYLTGKFQDELLQGDGWTKLQVLRFETGEKITGITTAVRDSCFSSALFISMS